MNRETTEKRETLEPPTLEMMVSQVCQASQVCRGWTAFKGSVGTEGRMDFQAHQARKVYKESQDSKAATVGLELTDSQAATVCQAWTA